MNSAKPPRGFNAYAARHDHTTKRACGVLAGIVLLALGLSGLSLPAQAYEACAMLNTFTNTEGRIPYRIDAASFDALTGISRTEGDTAVKIGADTWNEQATAGHFVEIGTASDYDSDPNFYLPEWKNPAWVDACDYIDASVVRVVNRCLGGGLVMLSPRCKDPNTGRADRFEIRIFAQTRPSGSSNDQCESIPWATGRAGRGEYDLAAIMVHEFGHALDLNHPTNDNFYATVMNAAARGTLRNRDVYKWDLDCTRYFSGTRSLTQYHRYHVGGVLRGEGSFINDVSQVSPGVTGITGQWNWAAAYRQTDALKWTVGLGPLNTYNVANMPPGIAPTEATWREDASWSRVFWPSHVEDPVESWASNHPVQTFYWQDGFSPWGYTMLRQCSEMSAWMYCPYAATERVYSGKPVSVAWNSAIGRSVFTWVHQDRSNYTYGINYKHNMVKVAFGYVDNYTITQPDELGVFSSVAPGVTCATGRAGGYDCIMAYVPDTDTWNHVYIKRFSANAAGNRYAVQTEPGIRRMYFGARTASRIATWYHYGKFWIAIRSLRSGQPLDVYSSVDGSSWAYEGEQGYSAIGPTAVSYWGGNNVLMYAR